MNNKTIKIKSAKWVKRQTTKVQYSVTHKKHTKRYDEANDTPVHKDLAAAFDRLTPHLAVMSARRSANEVRLDLEDDEQIKQDEALMRIFKVIGYNLGGPEDAQGVQLHGYYIAPDGRVHNFVTPFYKFGEADKTRYVYMDELVEALDELEDELVKYIQDGKKGDEAQLSMNFDKKPEEKVTKAQIAEEEKPLFKKGPNGGAIDENTGEEDVTHLYEQKVNPFGDEEPEEETEEEEGEDDADEFELDEDEAEGLDEAFVSFGDEDEEDPDREPDYDGEVIEDEETEEDEEQEEETDLEEGDGTEVTDDDLKALAKKHTHSKRVAQSADNPSGQIEQ